MQRVVRARVFVSTISRQTEIPEQEGDHFSRGDPVPSKNSI